MKFRFFIYFLLTILSFPIVLLLVSNEVFGGTVNWLSDENNINKLTQKAEEIAWELRNIAYLLIALFGITAIVIAFFRFFNLQSFDFYQIIVRVAIVFILLAAYPVIINSIYGLIDGICNVIYKGDIVDAISTVIKNSMLAEQKMEKGVAKQAGKLGAWVLQFIAAMGGTFLSGCITVMGIIRLFAMCILYVIGVIAIPLIIFPQASRVAKGWFIAIIEVGCWAILWKLVLVLFEIFQPYDIKGAADFLTVALYYITIGCVMLWTPKLISSLGRGIGIGESMSMAGTATMAFAQGMFMKVLRVTPKETQRFIDKRRKIREEATK